MAGNNVKFYIGLEKDDMPRWVYWVCIDSDLTKLENLVDTYIHKGWHPCGQLMYGKGEDGEQEWRQPMYRSPSIRQKVATILGIRGQFVQIKLFGKWIR